MSSFPQFCLALAVLLSLNGMPPHHPVHRNPTTPPLPAETNSSLPLYLAAPPEQSLQIFTGVFVIVCVGSVVVTLNAKLLGGKVSFFQSLCVQGYCLSPILLSAVVAAFVKILWIRLPVCAAAYAWSMWGKSSSAVLELDE